MKIRFKIRFLFLISVGIFFGWLILANASSLPSAVLIRGTGPEVYILENNLKRWIPNPEIFELFGYKWENINRISNTSLGYYADGDDLSKYDDYPEGSLVKGTGEEVYLIELGERRWIPNPDIFESYGFNWNHILHIDDNELDRIELADSLGWSESNKYPETIILEGPEEDSTLETAEVTFKYTGTNPLGPNEDLSFYAYLKGYDNGWSKKYSDSVTYKLSSESKFYTFYVRAENEQGYTDLTPAWRDFYVGVSPYYGKIEIDDVEYQEDDFEDDYIVLDNNEDEVINITGWEIINQDNQSLTIPQSAGKLTYPYLESFKNNIELDYRDEVIISPNSSSPIGVDFKTNECTGYLNQAWQFYPVLDEDCPQLDESDYEHLDKDCREFIDDLDECELPDYSDNYPVSSDSECVDFLNSHFSYSKCYTAHNKEIAFFGDQWRIFFNKPDDFLDNDDGKLTLRDKDGLIVDEYSY